MSNGVNWITFVTKLYTRTGMESNMNVTMTFGDKTVLFQLFEASHVIEDRRSISPYQGRVIDPSTSNDMGWASLILYDTNTNLNIEGAFSIYEQQYTIQRAETYRRIRRLIDADIPAAPLDAFSLVVFSTFSEDHEQPRLKRRDINEESIFCGSSSSEFVPNTLFKRAADNCPTTRKIVHIGVAADCTYVRVYGDIKTAAAQIINNVNLASRLYESNFNVALGIIKLDINEECGNDRSWNRECSGSYSILQRLNDFSSWRVSLGDDGAGLWHLMTKCSSGTTVGIAWSNTVCKNTLQEVQNNGQVELRTGAGVSSVTTDEWMVVAHEIGHNFGATHDCVASTCPCTSSNCGCCPCGSNCDCGSQYIMNPTSKIQNAQFSPCTITQICSKSETLGTCFKDFDTKRILQANQCGNGIKEDGEECDCGDRCKDNKCCDGQNCRLKNGAQCDDANARCCESCRFRPAGFICREKQGSCDLSENCSGTSGDCPPNKYVSDGTVCENGLKCASGMCTSRDLQCQQAGNGSIVGACKGEFEDKCSLLCLNANGKCSQFSGVFLEGTECSSGRCIKGICDSGGPSGGAIAGIVVGCILFVVLVGLGVWIWMKRRSRSSAIMSPTPKKPKIVDEFVEPVNLNETVTKQESVTTVSEPNPNFVIQSSQLERNENTYDDISLASLMRIHHAKKLPVITNEDGPLESGGNVLANYVPTSPPPNVPPKTANLSIIQADQPMLFATLPVPSPIQSRPTKAYKKSKEVEWLDDMFEDVVWNGEDEIE